MAGQAPHDFRTPQVQSSSTAGVATGYHVLMAYDGSEHAQAAAELAQDVFGECARGHSCRLTAMTVLPTQAFAAHESLQQSLNQVEQQMRDAGLPALTILKTGSPAASLIEYADEVKANLILIGAQGLRATLGILLGGVAQQVVEYSHVPVMVVRAPYTGIRRILLVDDGSSHGERTLDYLAPVCGAEEGFSALKTRSAAHTEHPHRIHGAPPPPPTPQPPRQRCSWLPDDAVITVMHVLQPAIPPDTVIRSWTLGPEVLYPAPPLPLDIAAIEKAEEDAGRQLLDRAQRTLNAAGLRSETVMRRGDAAVEIIRFAKEHHIDLIACGSRGLNPVAGWLLGSVSRKLVHYAPCSVLVVK